MKVVTIRLDPDLIDSLESEAETEGFTNRTEYIRWILKHRGEISSSITPAGESLEARVTDLEKRVQELEREQNED